MPLGETGRAIVASGCLDKVLAFVVIVDTTKETGEGIFTLPAFQIGYLGAG